MWSYTAQHARGVWSCPPYRAHRHKCEHCLVRVYTGERFVASVIIRNGERISNYLAHEDCHDAFERQTFGEPIGGQ